MRDDARRRLDRTPGDPIPRRTFLRTLAALPAAVPFVGLGGPAGDPGSSPGAKPVTQPGPGPSPPSDASRPPRLPALFVGHGSPMNAIEDNAWSRGFRALGAALPEASAILAVSAHWYVDGTLLTANTRPETIHDFGGFPQPLYEVRYPAPGDPRLAERVRALIGAQRTALSEAWGLDHGTWSVLVHTHPAAGVPVVQLSIDRRMTPEQHLALARTLAPLRDEGVLVVGSGNITHNLRHAFGAYASGRIETPDWAARFDADVSKALAQRDGAFLARALAGDDGRRAHPTPDHYLPLLYVAGVLGDRDAITFPIEGFDMGSLSMRAVLAG